MIPILDLKVQYAAIRDEVNAAIADVLENTQFVLGPPVKELEKSVAAYCETSHGIGVASGTDALRLCFAALNLKPGDEVITTPFTFIATANTISRSGATPVFVDIDPRTFNIDAEKIEAAITASTRAIVPVHLYGQSAEMDAIMKIAQKHNLRVIEDCAQSIGARYKNRASGSIGDAGCLSFFPSKNLGAYGDGGMIVSSDDTLADAVEVLRRHGGRKKYFHETLGFNSRLDTLQAAILNVKLKYLESWSEGRRRVAAIYNELLADVSKIQTPYVSPDCRHVYHQYTILAKRRDELSAFLKAREIITMVYYPVPLHQQPLYENCAHQSFRVAEYAAQNVLSLPMFPELTSEQQQEVADAIREFYGGR